MKKVYTIIIVLSLCYLLATNITVVNCCEQRKGLSVSGLISELEMIKAHCGDIEVSLDEYPRSNGTITRIELVDNKVKLISR